MRTSTSFIALAVVLCMAQLATASMPILAGKSSLRFGEITADKLADNSVSGAKLQPFAVGSRELADQAVGRSKLATDSIMATHFTTNSVTSKSTAIDLVLLHIDGNDPVESNQMLPLDEIPIGPQSVQPLEVLDQDTTDITTNTQRIDLPDPDQAYIVEAKARGPGVILGWYPVGNGHLLRYQHARSLRGLVCADAGIQQIDRVLACECVSTDSFLFNDDDDDGSFITTDNDCTCSIESNFNRAVWDRDLGIASEGSCDTVCTSLEDGYPRLGACDSGIQDPQCNNFNHSPPDSSLPSILDRGTDIDVGAIDDDADAATTVDVNSRTEEVNQPQACSMYTSVEDVNNPQEGVPNYAPSLESIEIDDTGVVRMRFFGYGGIDRDDVDAPSVDIMVVVLLDEQIGA